MAIVDEKGLVHPTPDDEVFQYPSNLEQFLQDYQQAKSDQAELVVARQVLALAIGKLPKQQLKLSLTDQTRLSDLDLQMKKETLSGAILFRAVKV